MKLPIMLIINGQGNFILMRALALREDASKSVELSKMPKLSSSYQRAYPIITETTHPKLLRALEWT